MSCEQVHAQEKKSWPYLVGNLLREKISDIKKIFLLLASVVDWNYSRTLKSKSWGSCGGQLPPPPFEVPPKDLPDSSNNNLC